MTKFTADHPATARVERFIEAQVQACRPSAQKLAIQFVLTRGLNTLTTQDQLFAKASEQIDHLENRMTKRLRRYYGLSGKYVGH